MFKPLYQFVLPALNNAGTQNYDRARWAFEAAAAKHAGGFTYLGLQVGGEAAAEGKVRREPVHVYTVAAFSEEKDALIALLPSLYPDQYAFFVAEIGLAEFIDGPAAKRDKGEWHPLPPPEGITLSDV